MQAGARLGQGFRLRAGAERWTLIVLKCRTKREMKNEQQVTLPRTAARPRVVNASVCDTKMFKIGGAKS